MEYLRQKWEWLAGRSPLANQLGEELVARHQEPQRHYHTLQHLQELFEWLDALGQDFAHQNLIGWSIWYHDAVYQPSRRDNEKVSAQLAHAALSELGLPTEDIQTICRWIEATQTHLLATEDQHPAAQFFMDIDLAILGSSPEKYMEYTQQIRQEYRKIPPILYRPGRRKVLKHFLEQPHIYQTPRCRELWETNARQNLKREIESL